MHKDLQGSVATMELKSGGVSKNAASVELAQEFLTDAPFNNQLQEFLQMLEDLHSDLCSKDGHNKHSPNMSNVIAMKEMMDGGLKNLRKEYKYFADRIDFKIITYLSEKE